jgi:hypothetical protein
MIDATIEVENPTEALRDEDSLFEVTSSYGHVRWALGINKSAALRLGQRLVAPSIDQSERRKHNLQQMLRRVFRGGLSSATPSEIPSEVAS